MDGHPGVMKDHPGTVGANPGAMGAHPGDMKTHPRVNESHPTATEAHHGAVKAHHRVLKLNLDLLSYLGFPWGANQWSHESCPRNHKAHPWAMDGIPWSRCSLCRKLGSSPRSHKGSWRRMTHLGALESYSGAKDAHHGVVEIYSRARET
jgi:hypothetical protein